MRENACNNELRLFNLWKLLDRSTHTIERLRWIELSQFGLTIEQSSILHTLLQYSGSLTTRELEEETMRQPNYISFLLNGMVKMGLLRREKNKHKQRDRIYLSPKGEDLIKKVTVVSIEMSFVSFTDKEKKDFLAILNKLLGNARELLGIPYSPPILQILRDKTEVKKLILE